MDREAADHARKRAADRDRLLQEVEGSRATLMHICTARLVRPKSSFLRYGIGLGAGKGWTLQIADAQRGRGGVGMSNSLPWVAAVPPLMH